MSENSGAAARRIMNRLGEDNRLPVVNIREADVGILLGFPLGGLLLGATIGVELVTIALACAGLTAGIAVVYAAPAQQTAWDWLTDLLRYLFRRPRETRNYRAEAPNSSTRGGLVEYTPFTPKESTQELTNVQRAWPGAGAVQRTDGTMEAFLEVEPANMDFAMSEDWMAVQDAAEEFANNELEYPLTFYATTRSFPAERLVRKLDDRLDDPDVETNPAFRELLEEYREQRPTELADTQQLRYFLGVEVDELEVYQRYEQEPTPGERLTEFPLIGWVFTPFVTRRESFDDAELRATMFEKLDDRLRSVEAEFIENVSGWTGRRLSTVELFVLGMEFWNGEEHDPEHIEPLLRDQPTVGQSERRRDA